MVELLDNGGERGGTKGLSGQWSIDRMNFTHFFWGPQGRGNVSWPHLHWAMQELRVMLTCFHATDTTRMGRAGPVTPHVPQGHSQSCADHGVLRHAAAHGQARPCVTAHLALSAGCRSWVLDETCGSHCSPARSLHSAIPPTPERGIPAAAPPSALLQPTLTRSSAGWWPQRDMSSAACLVGKTPRQPLCFLPPPAIHLVGDAATLQLYLGSLKGSLADTHTVWEQSAEESCKSRKASSCGAH